MPKIYKKAITVLIAAFLFAFNLQIFAGCNSNRGNPDEIIDAHSSIAGQYIDVFLFGQSHEVAVYEKLVSDFEEETGCNVNMTIDSENYFDLLRTSLMGNTPPDVFYVRPGDVRSLANQNLIVNLSTSTAVKEEEVDDIWEQAIDFFRYDKETSTNNIGNMYALPKDYSQYILGFNNKLVQSNAAGLARAEKYIWNSSKGPWADWGGEFLEVKTEDNATIWSGNIKIPGLPGTLDQSGNDIVYTYDELGALAYLLSDNGQWSGPSMSPSARVYGTSFWESMCLMGYVWGSEGEFLKDNYTKVNMDSDNFVEGYQGFLDLNNKWYAHAIGASTSGYNLFVDGKVIFYPVGTWDIAYFDNYSSKLDYDIMPWPISNRYANTSLEGRQDKWKARVDSVGYGIGSKSKNKGAAAQFIKYLSINEDVQKYLTESGIQIPNIESMAKGDYLNNVLKTKDNKNIAPANKQLLLNIAEGPSKNGHYGPTVYTYNDEWFNEFFSAAAATLWLTPPNQLSLADLKAYCTTYSARAQNKLNEAIQLEKEQRI